MNIQDWPLEKVAQASVALLESNILKAGNGISLFDIASFAKRNGYITEAQAAIACKKLQGYTPELAKLNFDSSPIVKVAYKKPNQISFSMYNPKTLILPKCAPALIQKIKSIPGFREQEDAFLLPFSKRNVYALMHSGFAMGNHVLDFMNKMDSTSNFNADFSSIKKPLKEYQKYGVNWLLQRQEGALLADEQGLGKTAQAIVWAESAEFSKVCIVCPASLKLNWQREITMWTGDTNSIILSGKIPQDKIIEELHNRKWAIINYDILYDWQKILTEANFSAFIFDEAQALKNEKSKRTKAATILVKGHKVLMLSGTPIENRPAEFYPIISMVDSFLFPNKTRFYERYCDLKKTQWGWDYRGAKNTKELNKILADTIMLRRKKADVLTELPEKQRAAIPVHLPESALKEYRKAEKDFIEWLAQNRPKKGFARTRQMQAAAMIKIGVLKRLAAIAKLPLVFDWIKTYLESEDKLVVFATHKEVVSAIKQEFEKIAVVVDGSVTAEKRQAACDSFQNNPKIKLFIGNIKAAGTGLTLTAAKDTLTVEYAWTSTAHDQCEDRVHRIGQKNSVMAYYLLAENTIEKNLIKMLDRKRSIVSQILDGEEPVDQDFFDTLLAELEQEK